MPPENITEIPAGVPPARRAELSVSGMTCGNCARHVVEAIQSVPGVQSASVDLEKKQASIRWGANVPADVGEVIRAVEAAGYDARVAGAGDSHADSGSRRLADWQLNLWIAVLGTAPILIGEWLGWTGGFRWVSLALASAVQIFAGAPFYRGAWNQMKAGQSNMDTLVALGSTTAFGYSLWALLSGQGGHVYFLESASIITLVSVGHWMESRVSVRASGALRKLLDLAPPTARRIDLPGGRAFVEPPPGASIDALMAAAGNEKEVLVSQLKWGDWVSLRPGDRVPTDGEIVAGQSAVDESMLTGESVPVDKAATSRLYAGTVNLNGRLVMRVTGIGEETALARIVATVQQAQSSRANIQRIGDRVSSVFVPIVAAVALVSGLWWGLAPASALQVHAWLAPFLWPVHPIENPMAAAFITAAAVLIIACPCAMGLATPAAIMAGANAAARRGILIRDGVALEKAGKVTAVVFDKTGTLTVGRPALARTWENKGGIHAPQPSWTCADLGAALAAHSTHPISQTLAKSPAAGIELADWTEAPGAGIHARISNFQSGTAKPALARLGSLKWLRDSGVDLAAGEAFIAEWSAQGATMVGLSVDASLCGLFAVKDALKPGAAKIVERLRRQGMKVCMVTGDHRLTAESIARETGIDAENVFAEARPEQKAEWVKNLQQQGERVAFVGDGINDAPALEQADLGIAVSRASELAREAADIVLLNSEIEAVPESLGLARATLRTIKENLFWAFFYNALGVPLAALGFMSPILCAAAMGFSDLIVIGNALRLRRWKLRD